jgi:hypothetical protein
LSREIEEDVIDALEHLAEMPRKEYEPALPDMGTMLSLIEGCAIARRNRQNIKSNKRLFYFTCDYCGYSESGFFAPSDPKLDKVICRSMYGPTGSRKVLPFGQICGREMKVEEFKPYEGMHRGTIPA